MCSRGECNTAARSLLDPTYLVGKALWRDDLITVYDQILDLFPVDVREVDTEADAGFGALQWVLVLLGRPRSARVGVDGLERVDVVCPGFTGDCLETLEEISHQAREAFLHAGGKEFHYIPCLNDQQEWIGALCNLAQQHLQGWPTQAVPDGAALEASRAKALALGARQ